MSYIADLHIHSKYSRATAKDMDLGHLACWAKKKGIAMLGTGDCTHPAWSAELEKELEPSGRGVYTCGGVSFVVTGEVANIYPQGGRVRRIHTIIVAPGLRVAGEIRKALAPYGDLSSDGRPILKLACDRMVELLSGIDGSILCIPAHAWTPHFGIFGSRSGFDSPAECFGDQLPKICAIETGLSSDPAMNWRWSALDRFTLISCSDAHSPSKIGREACVFSRAVDYPELAGILRAKDRSQLVSTIEFFPEEGKYHWDGHRACRARIDPEEAGHPGDRCPVCGRRMTIGVMHRIASLADRPAGYIDARSPTYTCAVPLVQIIASAFGVGEGSRRVAAEYDRLIDIFKTEFGLLLDAQEKEVWRRCPPVIAQGIMNVRRGDVVVTPGYDGEFGTVDVLGDEE